MERQSTLATFSLYRPVTVSMLFLVCLVLGSIAYSKVPLQLLPSGFTRPSVFIRVNYPNSAPEEAIEKVAEPLEGMLATISGVKTIRSSSSGNRIRVNVDFREGTNMELAYREVMDRVERVRPQFPEEIKSRDVAVFKRSTDDFPIAAIAIAYPEEMSGLDEIIETKIQNRLNRIDGVANVEVYGVSSPNVYVDLKYDALKATGTDIYQLIQKLQAQAVTKPTGMAYSGSKKLYIRTLSRFESLEEIKNTPVTPFVRVRDIADVKVATPAPAFLATMNGKLGVMLVVHKESNANSVDVCDKVLDFVKNGRHPPGLQPKVIFAQGTFIKKSLSDLQYTAFYGGLFAVIILFLFLRRVGLTLLVTLAVPVSVMITVVAMYFSGNSLNVISMMGMMLAIGMLVDNSVVVVESITRRWEEGAPPIQAALGGTSQVSLAIMTATLTTMIVFLPFMLIESQLQFWLKELGFPICVSLLASLFVALVFIPITASKFLGKNPPQVTEKGEPPRKWFTSIYSTILGWCLRHRFEACLLTLLITASAAIPIMGLRQADKVQGHSGTVRLRLQFDNCRSLGEAAQRVRDFEKGLLDKKEYLGIDFIRTFFRTNRGWMTLHLPTDKDPKFGPTEFFVELKKNLPRVPGVKARIQGESQDGGGGQQMRVKLYGDDVNVLFELAQKLGDQLKQHKDILDVDYSMEENSDEIHAYIRKDIAEKFKIPTRMVAGTIRYTLNGNLLPPAIMNNREVDIVVGLREEDRENLDMLKQVGIVSPVRRGRSTTQSTTTINQDSPGETEGTTTPTSPATEDDGGETPLSSIIDFQVKKAVGNLSREDKKTQISLIMTLNRQDVISFYREIMPKIREFKMPRGYYISRGSRSAEFQEMMSTGIFAITLDIVFVFLLMGVLFESFLLPLCVIISIPFAFLGVLWILYLTGTPLETMSVIGMVILVGVVVNNAIVLIDRVNQLKLQGGPVTTAILEACGQRFRPIMMTALTTIFGLIPMALGDSNIIGRPYYPLGRAVIGGLIASTILTLFVVPLFYSLLVDFQEKMKTVTGVGMGGDEPDEVEDKTVLPWPPSSGEGSGETSG